LHKAISSVIINSPSVIAPPRKYLDSLKNTINIGILAIAATAIIAPIINIIF